MQKFQNMEHSNSRTFHGVSMAWNFFLKLKDFQGLLKDPMNPVQSTTPSLPGLDRRTQICIFWYKNIYWLLPHIFGTLNLNSVRWT